MPIVPPRNTRSSRVTAREELTSPPKKPGSKFGQGLLRVPSRASLRQPKSRIPAPKLTVDELYEFEPSRAVIDWAIPTGDLTDSFHEYHFHSIVNNIYEAVNLHFQNGPLGDSDSSSISPWLEPINPHIVPELHKYVEMVARPDPSSFTPWDDLLVRPKQRQFVLQAVILRIFDEHIFSELLFGAGREATRYLREQDESFLEDDGYRRTRLRSVTVNIFLDQSRGMPPQFWTKVDDLSMSITELLLPVLNRVRTTWTAGQIASLEEFHQDIHDLVSYAGWFSVCIRRSSSIVRLDWLNPGDRFQPDQTQVGESIFEASRKEAEDYDRPPGAGPEGPNLRKPDRAGRAMISVVPEIKRHTARFDKKGEPLGINVHCILKPHVVYYYGLFDDEADREQYVSLTTYLEEERKVLGDGAGRNYLQYFIAQFIRSLVVLSALYILFYAINAAKHVQNSMHRDFYKRSLEDLMNSDFDGRLQED